ncbi:MAG TPA: hypothetical protein VEB86_13405 [Chryseosolibacter sp.]|nr:hypothetical protein [Chryseosolibacter sp.]
MEALNARLKKRIHVSLYAIIFLTGLLGISVILESCTDTCEVTHEYVYYAPVYTSLTELRTSVELTDPKPVETVGKIYIKDHWLFVNAPGKGIHVIDNSNPAAPRHVHFINIPGSYDLAVKGNILYADSYIDLVLLDISNIENIHEINRLENVFSNYNTLGFYLDAGKGLITEWVEQTEVKVYESDCDANIQPWGGIFYEDGFLLRADAAFNSAAAIAPGNGSGPGVGGSMARFTINENHLYMLDGGDVQTVDITQLTDPVVKGRTTISWDIETIFPYKQNLFIGSRTGMHILDVSNPEQPERISTYAHVRVCDPVVVQDSYAYVTLRSGTECEGFTNQLEVINIEDLTNPQLLAIHPMHNPHGLGIDNSTLFVCDGAQGLKVYDASDYKKIPEKQLAHYNNIDAFDVIPYNNNLIMIGKDGIFQYDYSDPANIKFLSKIAVVNDNP